MLRKSKLQLPSPIVYSLLGLPKLSVWFFTIRKGSIFLNIWQTKACYLCGLGRLIKFLFERKRVFLDFDSSDKRRYLDLNSLSTPPTIAHSGLPNPCKPFTFLDNFKVLIWFSFKANGIPDQLLEISTRAALFSLWILSEILSWSNALRRMKSHKNLWK